MTVYQAIHRMREMTARKQTFAVSFMSYSRERRESHGETAIEHASLIKNAVDSRNAYQDHMITLKDHDTGQVRQCWQPLLLSLNNEPLTSID